MSKERQQTQCPPETPPEWQVSVRRTEKEDGRYLIYYEFAPSPESPEITLERVEAQADPS